MSLHEPTPALGRVGQTDHRRPSSLSLDFITNKWRNLRAHLGHSGRVTQARVGALLSHLRCPILHFQACHCGEISARVSAPGYRRHRDSLKQVIHNLSSARGLSQVRGIPWLAGIWIHCPSLLLSFLLSITHLLPSKPDSRDVSFRPARSIWGALTFLSSPLHSSHSSS